MDISKMAITMSQTPEEVSVNVTGDLDLTTVGAFQANIKQAFELREGRKLVVDLRKTDYIDSAGLEQLLVANRKLFADSDRLLVRVIQGHQPQTVLAVTGFGAVMDVESSDEAR